MSTPNFPRTGHGHAPSAVGRPHRLTSDMQQRITDLIEQGMRPQDAAIASGISRSTFHSWMARGRQARDAAERDELSAAEEPFLDFLDAVERALTVPEMRAVTVIQDSAAKGSWRAAAWLLERRWPERWSNVRHRSSAEQTLRTISASDLEEKVHRLLRMGDATQSAVTIKSAGTREITSGPTSGGENEN